MCRFLKLEESSIALIEKLQQLQQDGCEKFTYEYTTCEYNDAFFQDINELMQRLKEGGFDASMCVDARYDFMPGPLAKLTLTVRLNAGFLE